MSWEEGICYACHARSHGDALGEASFNGQKGRVTNEGQVLLWTEPSTPQKDSVWSAMMVQVGKTFSNVDTL